MRVSKKGTNNAAAKQRFQNGKKGAMKNVSTINMHGTQRFWKFYPAGPSEAAQCSI